ncbi:ABC transporter ATP-binding protein [Colwellia psychrerythraea]|uniref:Phosphonate-transporting ATPase n=1 Tax=Colwellia psychrerythraea TaxID=28229 RepID=A0A099KQU5_COLPS|nr:ABC transporter ATP-binding protein [Colwellia psychrerythraea]KGJ92272.1 Phosphonate-transporting ATPase [Colwellia psychrerythraea]
MKNNNITNTIKTNHTDNNGQALVLLKDIKKVFFTDDVETHAINDINLIINKGEYLSITGPSGCGKSTLLSLLGLLDTSSSGSYTLAGHDVSDLNRDERSAIRNKEIGFIFQAFNLISDLTVAENVELPLTYRSDINSEQRAKMVKSALEKVDMLHRAHHFPSQLSGGQQQRVAVARAISAKPAIILADEPTGNLDSKNAQIVMALLDQLHQEGATICMVTHDPRSAARAERMIEVFDGKIVADQRTETPTAIAV